PEARCPPTGPPRRGKAADEEPAGAPAHSVRARRAARALAHDAHVRTDALPRSDGRPRTGVEPPYGNAAVADRAQLRLSEDRRGPGDGSPPVWYEPAVTIS